MTTPTAQPQPDRITAQEIRELFEGVNDHIAKLYAEIHRAHELLEAMRNGLQTAATPPAVGTFGEMVIDTIVMIIDEKGTSYKAKGTPYQKHGVRVWDEVLPALGIDPASLKPGPNVLPEPIRARVLMNAPTEEGKTAQPRKVTGKA